MFNKLSMIVGGKITIFISITVLSTLISGCNPQTVESKMAKTETVNTTNKQPSIIRVVDLFGTVMFSDTPTAKGANLHTGTLEAIGEASWVDIEYLKSGEKIRLKNGSLELHFGEPHTANIGGLDQNIGSHSTSFDTNTRIIKLKSGKLFASITKFEQLRKVKYYFSTNSINLNLLHGSFSLESDKHSTQVAVCEGKISIIPSYTLASKLRPNWPELSLSAGSRVTVNLTEAPKPSELPLSDKTQIANEFNAMGLSACSSNQ